MLSNGEGRQLGGAFEHQLCQATEKEEPGKLFEQQLSEATKKTNRAFLVIQMVKNLPAVQETWVQSLGWDDPWKKGMGTHSSILAWRIPWTEEPGGLQSTGLQSQT